MNNKKRTTSIIFITIILIVSGIQFANADLFDDFIDFLGSVTGFATVDTSTATVTIASIAPVINPNDVEVPATQTITLDSYINVSIYFNATDADGAGDLDNQTARLSINRTGEQVFFNHTCNDIANVNATTNRYNCTVQIWFFAGNGDWTVNVTIDDAAGGKANDSSNVFTIASTKGMEMNTALSWSSINLGDTNKLATENITVNNTGNVDLNFINITAYMLHGTTTAEEYIYAANFSANIVYACDSGDNLGNGTNLTVSSTVLTHGNYTVANGSYQEDVAFCLEQIEGAGGSLSVQTYQTLAGGAWEVNVD